MRFSSSKCTRDRFRSGSTPDLAQELTTLPDLLVGWGEGYHTVFFFLIDAVGAVLRLIWATTRPAPKSI